MHRNTIILNHFAQEQKRERKRDERKLRNETQFNIINVKFSC